MPDCKHFKFWICLEILMLLAVVVFTAVHILYGSEISKQESFITLASIVISMFSFTIIMTVIVFVCRHEPGQGQAYKHIETKTYSSYYRNVTLEVGSNCAICLEEKEKNKKIVALTCDHTYHKKCISECLKTQTYKQCPMCRRQPKLFTKLQGTVGHLHNQSKLPLIHVRTNHPVNPNFVV